MQSTSCIDFPPFHLDLANAQLRRAGQPIPLRPKTFAVLSCLIEHPGQLVARAELLDAVRPETALSDVVLMVCVGELRRAVGDDPKHPTFIETVHRRGYRFIGQITEGFETADLQEARALLAELA